jgi:hypothetical protein
VYFKELKEGITGKETTIDTRSSLKYVERRGAVPFGEPYVIDPSPPPPEDYEVYFKVQ